MGNYLGDKGETFGRKMKLLLIQRKEHILLKVESEIELAITVNKDRIKMNSELMDEIIKVELVKPELNYGKEIIQQTNNLIKANEYLCALDRMFKEIFDGKRNAQLNRFNNDYVQLLEVTYAEFESNKIGNCDNKFTLALINLIFRREVLRRAITDSKAALEAKESISNAYIAREQTIEKINKLNSEIAEMESEVELLTQSIDEFDYVKNNLSHLKCIFSLPNLILFLSISVVICALNR